MSVTLRPMTVGDLPLLSQWLNEPHVSRWWNEAADLASVQAKYTPRLEGREPTSLFIAEHNGECLGMLQSYHLDDYPEHAALVNFPGAIGIDLFIGDAHNVGQGFGPAMINAFLREVLPIYYPTAQQIFADPSIENLASIRAFEKAGFLRGPVIPGLGGTVQLVIRDV